MKTTFIYAALTGALLFATALSANDRADDYIDTLTELGYPAPEGQRAGAHSAHHGRP